MFYGHMAGMKFFFSGLATAAAPAAFNFFFFLTIDVAECRVEEVKKGSAVDAEEINLH